LALLGCFLGKRIFQKEKGDLGDRGPEREKRRRITSNQTTVIYFTGNEEPMAWRGEEKSRPRGSRRQRRGQMKRSRGNSRGQLKEEERYVFVHKKKTGRSGLKRKRHQPSKTKIERQKGKRCR